MKYVTQATENKIQELLNYNTSSYGNFLKQLLRSFKGDYSGYTIRELNKENLKIDNYQIVPTVNYPEIWLKKLNIILKDYPDLILNSSGLIYTIVDFNQLINNIYNNKYYWIN